MSKIIADDLDLLQKIDKRLAKERLDPFVKEFGGMIHTGKMRMSNPVKTTLPKKIFSTQVLQSI